MITCQGWVALLGWMTQNWKARLKLYGKWHSKPFPVLRNTNVN